MTSDGSPPSSPLLFIEVTPTIQRVAAGDKAIYAVRLENRGEAARALFVEIRGIPAEWTSIDFEQGQKRFPRETPTATIIITAPADTEGGERRFLAVVRGDDDESAVSCRVEIVANVIPTPPVPQSVQVETTRVPTPGVLLTPAQVTWQTNSPSPARLAVSVRNVGDTELDYLVTLEGLPADWYTMPPRLRIPGGEGADAQIGIHPTSRAKEATFSFIVRVAVERQPDIASEARGNFTITAPSSAMPPAKPSGSATNVAPVPEPITPGAPAVPPAVSISPRTTFKMAPRESANAILTIQNKSKLIERYDISVDGLPDDWYSLTVPDIRVPEGGSQQVPLILTPKPGKGYPAGEYSFRVRVSPHSYPDSFAEVSALIDLAGTISFDARLEPAMAEGRKEKFKLTLANTGLLPLSLWLEGVDSEGMCKFKFPAPPILDPGEEAVVPAWVGARRNGLLGQPESYAFRLKVTPAGGQASQSRAFDAQLIHRPFLGTRFAGVALFLGLLVATVGILIRMGPSKVTDTSHWVGCKYDDTYQRQRGTEPFVRQECGGDPHEMQVAQRTQAAIVNAQGSTATPSQTPAPDPSDCASAVGITVGSSVVAVTSGVRIRPEPGTQPGTYPTFDTNETAHVDDGPRCAADFVWWKITHDTEGTQGWIAEGLGQNPYIRPR